MKLYQVNESDNLTSGEQCRNFIDFMEREYPENLTEDKKVQAHDDEDFEWFISEFLKSRIY